MALADDLLSLRTPQPRPCRVANIIQEQIDEDPDTGKLLDSMITDPTVPIENLRTILAGHEIHLGWHTIYRHRLGSCCCGRTRS